MPSHTVGGDNEVDATTALAVNGVGIIALLAVLYRSLSTGALVTRREHENRMADKDKQIADRDAQIVMHQAASTTNAAQSAELLELAKLTVQHMDALEALARRDEEQ